MSYVCSGTLYNQTDCNLVTCAQQMAIQPSRENVPALLVMQKSVGSICDSSADRKGS
jgi:hypothetical protein